MITKYDQRRYLYCVKDIQSQIDHRRIDIKKVGVKTITYPVTVLDKSRKEQKTVASINMFVNLPHQFKGTHMSRFIEILNRFHGRIDIKCFKKILEEMKEKLDAETAHMEIAFPFFLQDYHSVSSLAIKCYDCLMYGSLDSDDDLRLDISVPVSVPISGRVDDLKRNLGIIEKIMVSVRFKRFMWLEDLIDMVEACVKEEASRHDFPGEPMETLLQKLAARFERRQELSWYSLTIESDYRDCRLFTGIRSDESYNPW
ncbi:MAG: GTP cyclohydrolase I FolE2 [Proteobacteria bacterium]|nr:MAG: GTP cyclohydrolase I FolE2 [Pseudomonadota bacterium]